jgi:hypothetical protein
MPPNKLEDAILSACEKAADTYAKMTNGQWLLHGPEHFLQNEVARAIWKLGFDVFIDASENRVQAELGVARSERSNALRKRFDISVFYKHKNKVRAVIELKTRGTWSVTGVVKDATKIEGHFRNKHRATTGYLLVYAEASGVKRRKDLSNRLQNQFPNKLNKTRIELETC